MIVLRPIFPYLVSYFLNMYTMLIDVKSAGDHWNVLVNPTSHNCRNMYKLALYTNCTKIAVERELFKCWSIVMWWISLIYGRIYCFFKHQHKIVQNCVTLSFTDTQTNYRSHLQNYHANPQLQMHSAFLFVFLKEYDHI